MNCVTPSKVAVPLPFVHTAPSAITRSPAIEISGSFVSKSRLPSVSVKSLSMIRLPEMVRSLSSPPALFRIML
jgi:hypothetical protein